MSYFVIYQCYRVFYEESSIFKGKVDSLQDQIRLDEDMKIVKSQCKGHEKWNLRILQSSEALDKATPHRILQC